MPELLPKESFSLLAASLLARSPESPEQKGKFSTTEARPGSGVGAREVVAPKASPRCSSSVQMLCKSF